MIALDIIGGVGKWLYAYRPGCGGRGRGTRGSGFLGLLKSVTNYNQEP